MIRLRSGSFGIIVFAWIKNSLCRLELPRVRAAEGRRAAFHQSFTARQHIVVNASKDFLHDVETLLDVKVENRHDMPSANGRAPA